MFLSILYRRFQFVNFHETFVKDGKSEPESTFALSALMEVPSQYSAMRELGYFTMPQTKVGSCNGAAAGADKSSRGAAAAVVESETEAED